MPQPPAPPNRRRSVLSQALLSFGVCLLGLNIVLEAIESGQTPRLVLGIAVIFCSVVGTGLSLWAALRRSR